MRLGKNIVSSREVGKVKTPGNLARGAAFAGTVLAAGIMASCATTKDIRPQIEQTAIKRTIEFPTQIREGKGTKEKPYVAYLQRGREESGEGAVKITAPLVFRMEGLPVPLWFKLNLTASQLRGDSIGDTVSELRTIIKNAVKAYVAVNGIVIDGKAYIVPAKALRSIAEKACQRDESIRDYLGCYMEMSRTTRGKMKAMAAPLRMTPPVPKKEVVGDAERDRRAIAEGILTAGKEVGLNPRDLEPLSRSKCQVGQLAVGQELSFSSLWRTTHTIKVTGLSKDTVTADAKVLYVVSLQDINGIFMHARFNDVEIPRSGFETTVNAMQSSVAGCRRRIDDIRKTEESEGSVSKAKQTAEEEKEKAIGSMMSEKETFYRMLAPMLAMTEGKWAEGNETANRLIESGNVVVESSNDREFILKVKGGKYDGRIIKLGRKIDVYIADVLRGEARFIVGPYRIESLSVDNQGNPDVKVGIDCSRDLWIESSHAIGRHSACGKQ